VTTLQAKALELSLNGIVRIGSLLAPIQVINKGFAKIQRKE